MREIGGYGWLWLSYGWLRVGYGLVMDGYGLVTLCYVMLCYVVIALALKGALTGPVVAASGRLQKRA